MAVDKPSLTLVSPIGAKPVDKSGHLESRPITTLVEGIWSVEYCRQHPQTASEAIKALQELLGDRDGEIVALRAHLILVEKDIKEIKDILNI